MKLSEYIEETGIPVTRLASRCELTYHQLYWAIRGRDPTLKTAVAIQKYTNGKVMPEDLLSESSKEEINQKAKRKAKKNIQS